MASPWQRCGSKSPPDSVSGPGIWPLSVCRQDIALDENKNMYVVDNVNSDVTVFDSKGDYFKKAGYGQDSLKLMTEPCAVAVDQRGVLYVCDRANGSIYRYQLSNSLDEDITPED